VTAAAAAAKELKAAWDPLMSELTGGVAGSPLRLANGSSPYSGSQTMYGLAQCTRDLNASECSRCVSSYTERLGDLFPNTTAGVVRGYSCYLRYQVGVLDITLPPAPATTTPGKHLLVVLIDDAARQHQLMSYCFFFFCIPVGPSSSSNSADHSKTIGILIGVFVGCTLIVVVIFMRLPRRKKKKTKLLDEEAREMDDKFEEGTTGPKQFRYGELAMATNYFSDKNKLGEGGFGSVYRGYIKEMDLHVAIKRVSKSSKQGRKEYASEVSIISRLRHRNLVQLIGWCHGGGELLLVYELMPNGSLDTHLYRASDDGALLPWPLRHEIVLGLGSALLYLHQDWEQCVLHRDVKPSNVMLDASFHAKLGDFGLARLVGHGRPSHTTVIAGTMGYIDPDIMLTGRANTESDVYSFGVVLLEIACGRRPLVACHSHRSHREEDVMSRPLVARHGEDSTDGDGIDIVEDDVIHIVQWVWEFYGRGAILDAADARLKGEFDAGEMETVMVVGLWCAQPDRSLRPSIRQAVNVLRREAPLPSLPAGMPVATFLSTPNTFYYTSSVEMGGSTSTSTTTTTTTASAPEHRKM
jgi:serine/threonine protein kinase